MTAVVTGGSRGIGKGIAEALLNKGFTVIVTARNKGVEIESLKRHMTRNFFLFFVTFQRMRTEKISLPS